MSNDVWILFGKALAVGLLIAAPVGPIGLLTINRTLDQGRLAGLATGLGAACADAVYGAIGAFGVTQVIDWLVGARGMTLAVLCGELLAAQLAGEPLPVPLRQARALAPQRLLKAY